MPILDRVIRNGEIITSEGSIGTADIGIGDGLIKQIGGEIAGKEEIDATGKFVLPGGVDAHVHLSTPKGWEEEEEEGALWVDDFLSGSKAALAGGITTVGNMTFTDLGGETPVQALARETDWARDQTIVDLFLHPVFTEISPQIVNEIPALAQGGCNSIKIFTVFPWFDSQFADVLDLVRRAGGHGMIALIHCEDNGVLLDAEKRLTATGHTSLNYYPESRPILAEVVATQRAVAIAETTGTPVYIVHLSSARALGVCAEAQARGVPVYVETRPMYLHLTRECFDREDAGKFVGQPPLRGQHDLDALWDGIRQGVIHTVCTDHAPCSLAGKLDPAHTISNLRPGVAELQSMLPLLYSEGVRPGRISLGRFVEVISTNAAKLFGLYPRKGAIAVGSDADLVIFDPDETRTVDKSQLKSNADYSVYEGKQATGWPIVTLRRGEVVFRDDKVVGLPGSGTLLSRGATMPV